MIMSPKPVVRLWLSLVALGAACTGTIAGEDQPGRGRAAGSASQPGSPAGPGGPAAPAPGATSGTAMGGTSALWRTAPLSRLTRTQISNVAADVLGARADISADLPDVRADDVGVDATLMVESTFAAAQRLAREATQTGALKGRCTTATDVATCVAAVVKEIGPLLWRRPLLPVEESDLAAKVIAPAASLGGDQALLWTLTALLLSPNFVFRLEQPPSTSGPGTRLSPQTIAERLAFLVWNSAPDRALLDAAAAGRLATPDQRRAFVVAQLTTDKGLRALRDAHRLWLGVDGLTPSSKDKAVAPEFTAAVVDSMFQQFDRTAADAFASGSGGFTRLWTADTLWMPAVLRPLYGLSGAGPAADAAKLPSGQRSGVLTQTAVMAASSQSTGASPITRGLYVYQTILCQERPVPPLDVPPAPAKVQNGQIVGDRERFEAHRVSPVCGACHQIFDGLGLGLEHYDLIGRWRERDGVGVLTGDGWTKGLDGVDRTFTGAVELGRILAASGTARACYSRRIVEWARGYRLTDLDVPLVRGMAALPASGDMSAVWTGIASDTTFDHRDFAQE